MVKKFRPRYVPLGILQKNRGYQPRKDSFERCPKCKKYFRKGYSNRMAKYCSPRCRESRTDIDSYNLPGSYKEEINR